MAALFIKTPYDPSHSITKFPNTYFAPTFRLSVSVPSSRNKRRLQVSSWLIEPNGGKLIELLVDEPLKDLKKGRLCLCLESSSQALIFNGSMYLAKVGQAHSMGLCENLSSSKCFISTRSDSKMGRPWTCRCRLFWPSTTRKSTERSWKEMREREKKNEKEKGRKKRSLRERKRKKRENIFLMEEGREV